MRNLFLITLAICLCFSCKQFVEQEDPYHWIPLMVTATAYNFTLEQTSYEHSKIMAWGDSIKPGVK
ncbi:hypothetical protein [Maribacter antarcticus]|uniref:hypothetical protein n=1 Tax=Maribacter antarcticus TaxID=505250 RepID=UPI000AC53856|nr:hypothetical protein [Maribacter antarcticus]